MLNFNVGLLGHVDSGKTTLAKALSSISSTAAFDKNPQSRERGITLDLGFSAVQMDAPQNLKSRMPNLKKLQLTFVDCPGHSSLIKTIIGGAQITDLVVLVIDAKKGIQTQTAECIVISELLGCKLIVAVNKIDQLDEDSMVELLARMHERLRKTFARTKFGTSIPIFNIAALYKKNTQELLEGICANVVPATRNCTDPFLMYVDHCFSIKGQGTICTGTILQGQVSVNDSVEIPILKEQRKVKSIQMFRQPVACASMGDRIGLCLTQFSSSQLERGVLTKPAYLKPIYAACVHLEHISYYKFSIKSKSKIHITVGHDTVMANITLFRNTVNHNTIFDISNEYEYIEQLEPNDANIDDIFVLLLFETPVLATTNFILIASKLDLDIHSNNCRLAFWGRIQWFTTSSNYEHDTLTHFNVFKRKLKEGTIQRFVNEQQVIVQNLFKKDANRDLYVGKSIELSTGEIGVIESTFGQTSKVKIHFQNGLKEETVNELKAGNFVKIKVYLRFKKYIYNKSKGLEQ